MFLQKYTLYGRPDLTMQNNWMGGIGFVIYVLGLFLSMSYVGTILQTSVSWSACFFCVLATIQILSAERRTVRHCLRVRLVSVPGGRSAADSAAAAEDATLHGAVDRTGGPAERRIRAGGLLVVGFVTETCAA